MTFTKFGIRDFQVQYCAGAANVDCDLTTEQNWRTLATTTGNDKVWRTYAFSPVTAKAVRIRVTAASDPAPSSKSKTKDPTGLEPVSSTTTSGPARITEIEAWE
jgi:hypothetical protein